MTFKEEIKKLVKNRKAKYKDTNGKADDNEIKATLNREKETTEGYNGRQLLELFQNADDQNSTEILIQLNTSEATLIIANKGKDCKPFSADGVHSLLLANLSSKSSNEYIGNKGLGFRSIINWSDEIIINSNNVDIAFSQTIAETEFKKIGSKLKNFPILAIPEVTEKQKTDWTTKIQIKYKTDYLEAIEEQITQLKPEILLFLNHLKVIKIDIDGDIKEIVKPTSDKWKIYSDCGNFSEELSDDDKEQHNTKYQLKIAVNHNISNNGENSLFSYFPTNININMPFIVHGTFDLDSTRNQLNKTTKNKVVLKKLVDLIIKTAIELSEDIDYKALSFLNYSHKDENLEKLGFYENIDKAIDGLEIYPCLDGNYRKKEKIVYSNNLSTFVKDNNFCVLLSDLLIPTDDENTIKILDAQELNNFSYFNKQPKCIEKLNEAIKDIDDRVDFIHLLIENKFEEKLPLLIDEEENIITDEEVYTPSNVEFVLPDFVKIKFINKEFFDRLVLKFEIDSNKAREIQIKLKEITNIHSYEPAPVLQKIISRSNEEIKNHPDKVSEIIQKMVQSLYENYQNLDSFNIPNAEIKLLNKKQELTNAKDLYLSKTYPSGELTEFLFADVFSNEEFLADISAFNFSGKYEKDNIESFFMELGVNKNTKFYDAKDDEYNYTNFVFEKIDKPENYRDNYLKLTGISNLKKIVTALSAEKIVLWIFSNEIIHSRLNDKENKDEFKYDKIAEHYNNYNRHELNPKPSYIKYQLIKYNIFKDYLVGYESLGNLINKPFNFDDEIFTKYEINKSKIESITLEIGAVDKFTDLSIEAVSKIIVELPDKAKTGKQTQSIYKLCIKHFEKHKQKLINNNYKLFATKAGEEGYFNSDEVFYNGNIKLPKKITETKAILNYPRRQSTQSVIDFFGINNLDSIEIEIITERELSDKTEKFNRLFEQIKPYILAYRIADIESDQGKRDELNKLKAINIKLCDEIKYEVDGQSYELSANDYIKNDNNYLIKINSNTSLEVFKNSFEFQESFADIIGLAFDIMETKNFRNMVEKDTAYIEQTIQSDIGDDAIVKAKELLGISDEFNSFWKAIYQLKGREYNDELKGNFSQIQKELKISIKNIDCVNLASMETCENIITLFKELDIKIQEFNKNAYYEINLSNYHQQKLDDFFNDNRYKFKQNLHEYCLNNAQQKEFLNKLEQYKSPSNDYAEILEVDYQSEFEQFIKKEFELILEDVSIDMDSIFNKNKSELGDDFEIIENNDSIKSLLYFEGFTEGVGDYIKQEKTPKKQPKQTQLENTIKGIKTATLEKPSPKTESKNSKFFTQSYSQQNKQKKKTGDKAERKVNQFLIKKYGKENVIWASRDKPNADHDFEYKDKNNNWWSVEVKTLSNNMFYLSKNEKKFAENNRENYKIFLVGDSEEMLEIFPVDFNNDKFIIEAENFSVKYELN